ncbi:MAG: decaprenyl-phosphate phosphoribosyltransferase [Ignavibacteria bacterium]|nr:decaprenyl-phosphate phosphoribosyltransferase [Ignavibacteria bacterium]
MKKQSFSKLISYLKLIRVNSWIKNIFVFVPLLFSKHLLELNFLIESLIGFAAFSLTSSFIYILNDIVDFKKDELHPFKKNRPIPSGKITTSEASILLTVLFMIVLLISFSMALGFVLMIWLYILINVAYTFYLKQKVLLDIFCIAAGFMIRVIAGALIISVYISSWLILTTLFLSLFLAVMKRRVEYATNPNASEQRAVLKDYSLNFFDLIIAVTATGVILCYALYTVAERTIIVFRTEYLVFTTLFVIFGIFRYIYVVFKKNIGENVFEIVLKDLPTILNTILYVVSLFYIIYFLNQ